jgi:uncharacterized protein (TIGR00369 family)
MSESRLILSEEQKERASISPAARLLSWRGLEASREQGRVRVEFQAKPEFTNPIGAIHGGFLSAMLDEVMGDAIGTLLTQGEFAPTVELKVNFIRPAQVGTLIAEGHITHRGFSLVFLQGELRTVDGQLIATASATAQIQRIRQPRVSS